MTEHTGSRDQERSFDLDQFQIDAQHALDDGRSVLVAAPTGSGKTVVAEHAIQLAMARGRRTFYTTPIKALSNQKFHDLVSLHGAENVGLLTGDNAINGHAPIVVMTTEVLRNMIYAGSRDLDSLDSVVLDEVHYLQDPFRGPIWEEIIIHAPRHVRLVGLSATVSNADELADWMEETRGPTDVIVETKRPVDLVNLYAVGDSSSERPHLLPVMVDGRPNPEGDRFDQQRERRHRGQRGKPRRRFRTPRRTEVVDLLADENLLPNITFIFSRAGCDEAARDCRMSGTVLTTPDERDRIRSIVLTAVRNMSEGDLDVLGFDGFLQGLEAGFAPHHAGMVPPFKEAVEACFVEGLVKVVFATETLALGINMPARSVVIEKLSKFTGEGHDMLTAAEYTQLTGRAGRRGIDEIGHAVVLWSPFANFGDVSGLVGSRSFRLVSAFRPTYNMAVNLVRRYDQDVARDLLSRSFAQFQTVRETEQLEHRLDRRHRQMERQRDSIDVDIDDLRDLRDRRRDAEAARRASRASPRDINTALGRLKPGSVIGGDEVIAVLSVGFRSGGRVRVKGVTPERRVVHLEDEDFDQPPTTLATLELPEPFAPNARKFQNQVAELLGEVSGGRQADRIGSASAAEDVGGPVGPHPLEDHPDIERELRSLARLDRAERDLAHLRDRIASRRGSITIQFEAILEVLRDRGYVEGWSVTSQGELLAACYHEADLLVAECLLAGVFDGLDAPELAALASALTYEHRSRQPPPPPWFPSQDVSRRYDEMRELAEALNRDEAERRLPLTRLPDPTFVAMAHAWAGGTELDDLLEDSELTGGDFVRNVKQLMDLLDQIGQLAPVPETGTMARRARDAITRGVVAASSFEEPNE